MKKLQSVLDYPHFLLFYDFIKTFHSTCSVWNISGYIGEICRVFGICIGYGRDASRNNKIPTFGLSLELWFKILFFYKAPLAIISDELTRLSYY